MVIHFILYCLIPLDTCKNQIKNMLKPIIERLENKDREVKLSMKLFSNYI